MEELNNDPVEVLDFSARPEEEQQDFLRQTWCNECMEMDLGMKNPMEYATSDRVWIEGDCVKCSQQVITEIVEEDGE
ncbi:MAG: hypothetical protein ACTIM4_01760 [Marinomonas sp.]